MACCRSLSSTSSSPVLFPSNEIPDGFTSPELIPEALVVVIIFLSFFLPSRSSPSSRCSAGALSVDCTPPYCQWNSHTDDRDKLSLSSHIDRRDPIHLTHI